VDGELVRFGENATGRRAPDIAEKAAFFGELLWLKRERGRGDGWEAHQYRAKFGVWPNEPRVRYAPRSASLATMNWVKSRTIAYAKARAPDG
jgi:DNA repair protein RadD